ncbi:hypothetical protein D3C85_1868940 [compost metagenome]
MLARHWQHEVDQFGRLARHAVADAGGEDRLAALVAQIAVTDIGLRVSAVGDDAPILDLADQ